ncbi:hypothetical protein Xoosp13_276 [Xanthomonas phage Xoo-sp13]|nr:hypothetical protein Xoosp13_276 [Xanthomonas phage Xoo-sp13]
MDKREQLSAVIDGIINDDMEAAKAAFSTYVSAKTQEVLGYNTTVVEPVVEPAPTPVQESKLVAVSEMFDAQVDSPVRLRGDRVFVEGKQVGVLQSDPVDFDSGINFIEDGGRFSKEFSALEELYSFLISRYTKRGDV